MDRKIRFLLIMCCLAVFSQVHAQFDDPKTLEIGPHGGGSYYMGDINPVKPLTMMDWQYGGVVRFNYNNRWSFRFDYTHATVKSDDTKFKWRPERGLNFTTNINDFSVVAEFNFLEYYTGNPKRNVSPYIFGGISLFQYTPYTNLTIKDVSGRFKAFDTLVNIHDYETEPAPPDTNWFKKTFGFKSSKVGLSIPFGVGVKLSLTRHMAATVEWRMQKTFTNYLDDVATVYPEKGAPFEYKHIVYLKDANGNPLQDVDIENSCSLIYNLSDPTATPIETMVDNNGTTVYPILIDGDVIMPVLLDGQIVYQIEQNGSVINVPYESASAYQQVEVPNGRYSYKQQRGNSAFNDWFGMIRISLTWKFNLPDGRGCNLSKF